MHPLVLDIAHAARAQHGRAYRVGGCVRDEILGVMPKDEDMEVYGIPEDRMESMLRETGASVLRTGRAFAVWKVWNDSLGEGNAIDVALPRREMQIGPKHTDFKTVYDPNMSIAEAAKRRDFTINAILQDPLTGEIVDFWGGKEDLAARVLRHVSPHFAEDPLRVLRGAQFCGRFALTPAFGTVGMCMELTPQHLPKERLWTEWKKLILKSIVPSFGLKFLNDVCWTKFFPEIEALEGVKQDPHWHPEGDVWAHTLHCLDAYASTRIGDEYEDLVVGFAVLCHDFGKPATTEFKDGRWRAHGHEAAGEEPTRTFLSRLTDETSFINDVVGLVTHHMVPSSLRDQHLKGQNPDRAIRRLATRLRIDRLARVCWCDSAGRPPLPKSSEDADWIRAQAERLLVKNSRPVPLVQGRDLIAIGHNSGPHLGPALKAAYEAQLDGTISTKEEALALAVAKLQTTS